MSLQVAVLCYLSDAKISWVGSAVLIKVAVLCCLSDLEISRAGSAAVMKFAGL